MHRISIQNSRDAWQHLKGIKMLILQPLFMNNNSQHVVTGLF